MGKFTADFETTVDENDCRVWAYAICEIGNLENFIYGNSIDDFMNWCEKEKNHKIYFHNLKFDGQFILAWLFRNGYEFVDDKKDAYDHSFSTLITDMGQFFSIEIYFKTSNKKHINKVTFYDSMKILNFSVSQIAKDFDLPIRKLKIDYKAKREVGHILTHQEVDYIRNDVEIMARALQIMFDEKLTKITIASDALQNYKDITPNFNKLFPVLDYEIDQDIRRSYKGGFTYAFPSHRGEIVGEGIVYDVNSLYPSIMVNKPLPYGQPVYFEGEYQEDKLYPLYVQRLSCEFKLKEGKIPSIQLKGNMSFRQNEYVESSNGEIVTMTLTSVDLELFFENYEVIGDIYYDGGWKFRQKKGLFTDYINQWTEKKIQAKKDGNLALYQISKLMLNSLYGKFGLNPNSRLKRPVEMDGVVKYSLQPLEERKPVYIPVATFITSYGRDTIIRSALAIRKWGIETLGYDPVRYCDTDSLHINCTEEQAKPLSNYINIDDYILGYWKLESKFQKAKFIRAKSYIEQGYDGKINVTIAGLPKKLSTIITFENFASGFTTKGMDLAKLGLERKLTYKQVEGGVLLVETDFTIK